MAVYHCHLLISLTARGFLVCLLFTMCVSLARPPPFAVQTIFNSTTPVACGSSVPKHVRISAVYGVRNRLVLLLDVGHLGGHVRAAVRLLHGGVARTSVLGEPKGAASERMP